MSANVSIITLRWHTIRKIATQQSRDTLFGWGIYITAAVSVGFAALQIFNAARFVGESSLNIIAQPFLLPLQVALSLAMLFVAIEATLTIARPREQGSLQILFFAPIDESILVGGNFLAGLLVYILFVLLTLPILFLLAWVTNFVIPTQLLWATIPTLFVVSVTIAFGLFVSAAAPSARAAVLILVAGILILLGLQSAYIALLNIPPTSRFFDAFLFIRTILANLQTILSWLSPFRMLDVILTASLNNDWLMLIRQLGIALVMTAVWLFTAVRMLQRRGVLP
ncbi:MAG: ABC transporter permease subunit [Chloroflexi bacterium]|nr:ABC transporter permease subunit [Chloroflexota bacterium]